MQKKQLQKQSSSKLETIQDLITFEKNISLEKCVEAEPLAMQLKTNKEQVMKNIDFALSVSIKSVGQELSEDMIKLYVHDLIDKWKYESIEDVILVLKKIRSGDVKIYGSFNLNVFNEEMAKHLDAKYQLKETQLSQYQHGSHAKPEKELPGYDKFKANYLTQKKNE